MSEDLVTTALSQSIAEKAIKNVSGVIDEVFHHNENQEAVVVYDNALCSQVS